MNWSNLVYVWLNILLGVLLLFVMIRVIGPTHLLKEFVREFSILAEALSKFGRITRPGMDAILTLLLVLFAGIIFSTLTVVTEIGHWLKQGVEGEGQLLYLGIMLVFAIVTTVIISVLITNRNRSTDGD